MAAGRQIRCRGVRSADRADRQLDAVEPGRRLGRGRMRWRRQYLELTYAAGRYRSYEAIVREAAIASGVDAAAAERLMALWPELPLWPETPRILDGLASRVPLGVATNCSKVLGLRAVEKTGGHFAAVVTAEAAGFYKPRPEPYRAVLGLLGTDAGRDAVRGRVGRGRSSAPSRSECRFSGITAWSSGRSTMPSPITWRRRSSRSSISSSSAGGASQPSRQRRTGQGGRHGRCAIAAGRIGRSHRRSGACGAARCHPLRQPAVRIATECTGACAAAERLAQPGARGGAAAGVRWLGSRPAAQGGRGHAHRARGTWREIMPVRQVLEALAARCCAERAPEAAIASLSSIFEKQQQAIAVRDADGYLQHRRGISPRDCRGQRLSAPAGVSGAAGKPDGLGAASRGAQARAHGGGPTRSTSASCVRSARAMPTRPKRPCARASSTRRRACASCGSGWR